MIPQYGSGDLTSLDESLSQVKWALPEALQYLADEGDYEGVAAILARFTTDTTSRLNLLHNSVAIGDVAEIRRQAHAISGSARLVGADAIVSLCRKMEEAANASSAELSTLAGLIQTRFEEVCRAIGSASGQSPAVPEEAPDSPRLR